MAKATKRTTNTLVQAKATGLVCSFCTRVLVRLAAALTGLGTGPAAAGRLLTRCGAGFAVLAGVVIAAHRTAGASALLPAALVLGAGRAAPSGGRPGWRVGLRTARCADSGETRSGDTVRLRVVLRDAGHAVARV